MNDDQRPDSAPPDSRGHEHFAPHGERPATSGVERPPCLYTALGGRVRRVDSGDAAETDQAVCTQDLDFSALLAVSGRAQPSLITLRLSNPSPQIVTDRLLDVLPAVTKDVQQGAVVIIEDRATRVRSLPIQE